MTKNSYPMKCLLTAGLWLSCVGWVAGATAVPRVYPAVQKRVEPSYQTYLRETKMEAQVCVSCLVGADGRVQDARVLAASDPRFDGDALRAVRKWRFFPAVKGGSCAPVWVPQMIFFALAPDTMMALWRRASEAGPFPPDPARPIPPLALALAAPVYPSDEYLAGRTGSARIDFTVSADGRVNETPRIDASAPAFGEALAAAARKWRFVPARDRDGKPGGAVYSLRVEFTPEGSLFAGIKAVASLVREKSGRIVDERDLDEALYVSGGERSVPLQRAPDDEPERRVVVDFYVDQEGAVRLPRAVDPGSVTQASDACLAVAGYHFQKPKRAKNAVVARVRREIEWQHRPPARPETSR